MVEVVVLDPLPMFRHGVSTMLRAAGHAVETPADLLGWARGARDAFVVMTLLSPTDWSLLADLRDHAPGIEVIALLDQITPTNGASACRGGAICVVPRDATMEALRGAVEAALDGNGLVPAPVLQLLAGRAGAEADADRPSEAELRWLRTLAGGATVAQLAKGAGYSERAMFRLLHALYLRIGVRTRVEALVYANERGWLHLSPAQTGPPPR